MLPLTVKHAQLITILTVVEVVQVAYLTVSLALIANHVILATMVISLIAVTPANRRLVQLTVLSVMLHLTASVVPVIIT